MVFFTVVTHNRRRLLDNPDVHTILREIWLASGERNGWWVGDYILMPDHVHLFARAGVSSIPMKKWVGLWKSLSSRRVAKALALNPPIWQADYFDRYLRSSENYAEKWHYVERNALSDQLVVSVDNWPYRGRIHTLMY